MPVARVNASTPGITGGAEVTFDYRTSLGYPLPNGSYYLQTHDNQFTVNVASVDNSYPPGIITYKETFTLYNDTTVDQSVSGTTPFFDPYDNKTYVGSIGFYPFAYTDIAAGSIDNIPVSLAINGPTNVTSTTVNRINATVSRSGVNIIVNITVRSGSQLPLSHTNLNYNATNGVLLYGETDYALLGTDRRFVYTLSSYTPGSGAGDIFTSSLGGYLTVGAFAAFAVVGISVLFFRGKHKGKKFKGVKRQR
jgi:hypothetical protein